MMKRSRKELKVMAKRALLGHYGTVVGSLLLSYLILFATMIPLLMITLIGSVVGMGRQQPMLATISMLPVVGVWYILVLLGNMLLMVGLTRICYQFCVGETGRLGDLFYAFKNHPLRFAWLSIRLLLIGMLGGIPGLVLMARGMMIEGGAGIAWYLAGYLLNICLTILLLLRYTLAVFVLLEEPWRNVGECIRLSKEMMHGNKMRLFKLQFSFFGVMLLAGLSLGVGTLWATPYIITTIIFFYLSVKEETYGRAPAEQEAEESAPTQPREYYI